MAEQLSDEITSGLRTDEVFYPWLYGFRVWWISWDSGFRGSGLVPGDVIVGLDGKRFDRNERKENDRRVVGRPYEKDEHKARGVTDGTLLRLLVERDQEQVEFVGTLRARRTYSNAAGRSTLGPGGPSIHDTDGFSPSWELVTTFANFLGDRGEGNHWTRVQLENLEKERERVAAMRAKYPGPFADQLHTDYEATVALLRGRSYQLTDDDLAYRRLGEQRRTDLAEAAKRAWTAALARHAPDRIEPFPSIDPVKDDRSKVAGKVVVFEGLTTRDVFVEAGHGWYAVGGDRKGWYYIDRRGPGLTRMFDAEQRYRKCVIARIEDKRSIIGRILPSVQLLVRDDRAIYGLEVEPLGVSCGDQLFVDLETVDARGESPFAGEDTLKRVDAIDLPDDATPRQVMEAFYRAIEEGDEAVWGSMYADWHASWSEANPSFDAMWTVPPHWKQSEWARTRSKLEKVYDVRVVRVGKPYVYLAEGLVEGIPLVEEVEVVVDHVGKFGDEWRQFKEQGLNRLWHLQRVAGGPWRISWNRARHGM
jgi:hypothetical protein